MKKIILFLFIYLSNFLFNKKILICELFKKNCQKNYFNNNKLQNYKLQNYTLQNNSKLFKLIEKRGIADLTFNKEDFISEHFCHAFYFIIDNNKGIFEKINTEISKILTDSDIISNSNNTESTKSNVINL